ncbi:MAG: ATP-binding cassette domain-containing protein [Alphaproteobacteria bacterium]|nr:ATP-binding cassette domain-containing protein [Alphaproteobacteria bacterium]
MLAVEAARKRFLAGTAEEMLALDGVSLTLAAGDFVTVIGSNGAGKSTLLKVIVGLVALDEGKIVLDGRDVTAWPAHRRAALIGRIAQDPHEGTCAAMTIAENLALAARRGAPRRLVRAVTPALARQFRDRLAELGLGLENRLDTRVAFLSGGQRQALALLMATLAQPRLLLLDEHLANLDPRTAALVMTGTERLVAAGRLTTMMVTHDMSQAIRVGNRLVMLHQGRIVFTAAGPEKAALTVASLVEKFHAASGEHLADDRVLLTP